VVTFYRSGWCRYCNIQLRAYRAVLPQTADLGARLVAISPQLPEQSISPSAATAIIALLPVVASLLAIPVLGEIPLPAEWVAIIVIGMGVCLAARGPSVRFASLSRASRHFCAQAVGKTRKVG
jgi:hypothetical protein